MGTLEINIRYIMKIGLVLFSYLFILSLGVHANEFDKQYKEAMIAYNSKNYSKSYEIFSKIYLQKLSSAKLNFYYGRSAYEKGHYIVAIAAFERVEMLDAGNLKNKFELARTYYMLKMYEYAYNLYKEVLENPNLPNNIRLKIELALSKVSKVQEKSFTYARVMANIIYDSNINFGSVGNNEYLGRVFPVVQAISDSAAESHGDITNIYDIGTKGGYSIKNRVSYYVRDYFKENDYDLGYFLYSPSLIYQETKYLFDLNLGIDATSLNNKFILKTYFIAPSLVYEHSTTLKSIVSMKYQSQDFTQENRNNFDSSRYELTYSLQNILSAGSYIQANLNTALERKVRGDNAYVDFNEYKLSLSYANQFTSIFGFDSFAQVRKRSFRDVHSRFGSKRNDLEGLGNVNFSARFYSTWRASLKGSYEYVNSNHSSFSYEKYIIGLGIIKTF